MPVSVTCPPVELLSRMNLLSPIARLLLSPADRLNVSALSMLRTMSDMFVLPVGPPSGLIGTQ